MKRFKINTKDNFIFCLLSRQLHPLSQIRAIKCNFSLDFSAFGPSILVGPRSKVDLHYKGYVWTPILWSFDNSKR